MSSLMKLLTIARNWIESDESIDVPISIEDLVLSPDELQRLYPITINDIPEELRQDYNLLMHKML